MSNKKSPKNKQTNTIEKKLVEKISISESLLNIEEIKLKNLKEQKNAKENRTVTTKANKKALDSKEKAVETKIEHIKFNLVRSKQQLENHIKTNIIDIENQNTSNIIATANSTINSEPDISNKRKRNSTSPELDGYDSSTELITNTTDSSDKHTKKSSKMFSDTEQELGETDGKFSHQSFPKNCDYTQKFHEENSFNKDKKNETKANILLNSS